MSLHHSLDFQKLSREQLIAQLDHINIAQNFTNRFRTNHRGESTIAIIIERIIILLFGHFC